MSNIIFYGLHVVKNLLKYKNSFIKEIFILKSKRVLFYKKFNFLLFKKIKITLVNKGYLNSLTKNRNHQDICVLIKKNFFLFYKKKILNIINKIKYPIFLILDRINDVYNLGSCIRTAVASGIINVILVTKHNSVSILNSVVHKITSGALYKINIFEINNINNLIIFLKKYNFFIIGTCLKSKNSIFSFNFKDFKKPIGLILGSEKNGIKESIKKKCDFLFRIPIKNINSLNISIANSILIFEILRQFLNK